MSERERWIIYPLLFFALGAGIRDKILQRVEVKEIVCENLKVVDLQDPLKPMAELGFWRAESPDPTNPVERMGRIRMFDSEGKQVCNISHDVLVDRLITCKSLRIVDQNDPNKPLAELSYRQRDNKDPSQLTERVGHLRLVDSDGQDVCSMANDVFINRLIGRQMLIVDPSQRPLVLVGTEPVAGAVTQVDGEPVYSYQGVIYLNNRPLGTGVRLAPPAKRSQAPAAKPQQPAASSDDS